MISWHFGAMTDDGFSPKLWKPRSTEETLSLYADWAATYEADVAAAGYVTPARVAQALAAHLPDGGAAILDFGCGTGLSGMALRMAGYNAVDGTDVSAEMLAEARKKRVYQTLTTCTPGELPQIEPGAYQAITACGVISLGAAPASLLAPLLDLLAPGGLLVFSYNEATLREADYHAALAQVQTSGLAVLQWAENGPHLPEKPGAQTSTVYVLRRT